MQEDNNKMSLDDVLNFDLTPPEKDRDIQALEKYASKRSVSDLEGRIDFDMGMQSVTDPSFIKSSLEATNYTEVVGQAYMNQWNNDFYTDTSGFQAIVDEYRELAAEYQKDMADGVEYDKPGSLLLNPDNWEGMAAPSIKQVALDGRKTILMAGSEDDFMEGFFSDDALSNSGMFGKDASTQTEAALMTWANGAVGEFVGNYPGFVQHDPVERYGDDMALVNETGAFTFVDTALFAMGDVFKGRVFTGDSKVLLADSMYDTALTKDLEVRDPDYRIWAASIVQDFDRLSQLAPDADGYLPGMSSMVRKFGKEEILDLLKNTNNSTALTVGLNRLTAQRRMSNYTQYQSLSLGMNAKLLAHGFASDPTMALDVGVGMAMMAAGTVTGLAPIGAAGAWVASTRLGSKLTRVVSTARQMHRAMSRVPGFTKVESLASPAANNAALLTQKAGRVIVNARRALPSQVFSELVFPSLTYMRRGKSADGVSWGAGLREFILTDAQFANRSFAQKALTRAYQNGLEGGIQGWGDYYVMHANEKAIIEATYGSAAADAFEIDRSGLMMMVGAGLVMGGAMGSGMGAAFDGVGNLNNGLVAKILDNKFSKGIGGVFSEAASHLNNFKVMKHKQTIMSKLTKAEMTFDEAALDKAMDTKLRSMEVRGLNVDYGIRQALRELDGEELNVDKFINSVRDHASQRAMKLSEISGRPVSAQPDLALQTLRTFQVGMRQDQIDDLKSRKPKTAAESKAPAEVQLPEAMVAERTKLEADKKDAAKRSADLQQNVTDAANLRSTESGRIARGLNKEAKAELDAHNLYLKELAARERDLSTAEINFREEAAINDMAGNELDILARLMHLAESDVNNRLTREGKGRFDGDIPLDNIWKVLDAKADDDSVSTTALRETFTAEERFSTMIEDPETGRQTTLEKALQRHNITAKTARTLVERAREAILKDLEMRDITFDDMELEMLGRALGSDEDAKQMITQAEAMAKIAAESRGMEGEVETTGLTGSDREVILKYIPENADAQQQSNTIYAEIDKRESAIVTRRAEAREMNDPELLDLQARKKRLEPSEDIDLEKAIESRKAAIRKGVEKDWKTTRKNLHTELMSQVEVMNRSADGHVVPLMAFINRLRYEASKGHAARFDSDGALRFGLHRKQVLSMLPPEYRFLINTFDNAKNSDGTFDLDGMINSVLYRIGRADEDMKTLLVGGAENRARMLRANDGLESIELTKQHLDEFGEAQADLAKTLWKQRGGEYAGGGGRSDWESDFAQAFSERNLARIIRNDAHLREVAESVNVEVPEGPLTRSQILEVAREIYRSAGLMEDFADFGGGPNARAYFSGSETAFTIIESLESPNRADGALDDANRFKLTEGSSRDVTESARPDASARRERRKTQSDKQRKRLGNISTSLQRRLYEQTRTNERVRYLLFNEDGTLRSDEDVNEIEAWLKTLKEDDFTDTEMHGSASGSQSFRLAPPEWVASASDTLATDVDSWVKGVQKSLRENPPAMIATIHDAIDSALPGMFGALSPALQNVSKSGFASAQGVFGLGFGYRTLMARPGSLTDSMNTAFELTLGIRGWAERARKEFGEELSPELQRLGLVDAGAELIDEELIGAIARGLNDPAISKEVQELFFPEAAYLDADASGANILMANIKYNELRSALESGRSTREILKTEATEGLGRDGFSSADEADLYKATMDLTRDALSDDMKIAAIVTEATGEASTEADIKAWKQALTIWADIMAEDGPMEPHLRNGLFKAPVMTDLYQIGVDKMGDDIVKNFFRGDKLTAEGKEALASVLAKHDLGDLRADQTGSELTANNAERALASKLAHLLHSSRENVEGSLVKQAVFGDKTKTNSDIGKEILAVREQQIKKVGLRDVGELLNSPEKAKATAKSLMNLGTKDEADYTAQDHANLALGIMLVYRAAQESNAPNMAREAKGVGNTFNARFDEAMRIVDEAVKAADDVDAEGRLGIARAALEAERRQNTARSDAFNSLANQNFHIDENKARALMAMMIGGEASQALMDNLDPLALAAMRSGFFRNLSTSVEGRFFVNTVLDMIGDKSSRVGSIEAPIGTAKFFGADGKGMDEAKARRAAIMQLAVNAAEMTGRMPDLSGKPHTELTTEKFMRDWTQLDAAHDAALNGAGARVSNEADFTSQLRTFLVESGLPLNEDVIKDAAEQFAKLRKNALSGRTDVNDLGDESAVTRMGPWGMVDPRLNYNSTDAVGLAAATQVQMAPRMNRDLQTLAELDAMAGVETGEVFSRAEMENGVDASDMAIPTEPLEALDMHLSAATDFGVGGRQGLRYKAAVMQVTLDKFADDIGTDYAIKLKKAGKYDELYVLFREVRAWKAESDHLQSRSSGEVADLQAYGYRLIHNGIDPKAARGQSIRYRARLVGRREVNKSGQWARDLENAERSILSLEADPNARVLFTGADTWEDNLARTAQMNPSGQMMSWLFKPADSHGRFLAKMGTVRYTDNHKSSRTPLFAQMSDSQFLTATALVESYTWKRVFTELGLENMTAERYRQLRAATEDAMGAEDISTEGFDESIAALFRPDRIDQTFATMAAARKQAELELHSTDFVSDLGATGEGRMLFNEQLSDPVVKAQIMKELNSAGRTMDDFENEVFNKTIASEGGKEQIPTAFVNMYGEVINPHKILGQGRIALTSDERVRALNLTSNRRLLDRMRTGSALGLNKTAFEAEVSARMAGYDGEFGAPLKKVRRQAAEEAESIRYLMAMNSKRMRKNGLVTELSSGKAFLNVDAYETEDMIKEAKKASALRDFRNAAPVQDSDLTRQWDDIAKRMAKDTSLQDAMVLVHMKGELDRAGVAGVLRIEYPDMKLNDFMNYVDRVIEARAELTGYLNDRLAQLPEVKKANAVADEAAQAFEDADSPAEQQLIAHDAVETVVEMELPGAHTDLVLDKLTRRADPALVQEPAPSRQDVLNDDTDTLDPRAIDDGRVHNKMLRLKDKGGVYARVDSVFQALENKGVVTPQERLLLDATMYDTDESIVEATFLGTEFSTPDMIEDGAQGRFASYLDVERVVQRIELARDIHKRLNPDVAFGAAGVLLEEVGHMIELRMMASNPTLWGSTVASYMKKFGQRMDPVFKEVLGQTDPTRSASEGFARGYAAVMLNRGAREILNGMDKTSKQWFSEANHEALKRIAAFNDHTAFRQFKYGTMDSIERFLKVNDTLDVEASVRSLLTTDGRVSEDTAWKRYHNDDESLSSRRLSSQDAELIEQYRGPDGRLDMVALREAYGDDPTTMFALASAAIESDLEVIGGGAEVTTALGRMVMTKLDKIHAGLGRKTNHFLRSAMAPAALLAKGFDAAYGVHGQMTTVMRGLFTLMSPTETMSMGGFSTLGGGRVPTLNAMQAELRGRWDAPMETLYLMKQGDLALKEQGGYKGLQEAVYASLLHNSDAPLDVLDPADKLMATAVRDDIRTALKLTSDDMLEAGLLKSEGDAKDWADGLPLRVTSSAINGDGSDRFRGALQSHVAKQMRDSNDIDTKAIGLMTDDNGDLVWTLEADQAVTPTFIESLRGRAFNELADVLEDIVRRRESEGLSLSQAEVLRDLSAMSYKGDLTKSKLGDTFTRSYNHSLTAEVTNPLAIRRARDLNKSKRSVTEFQGYASIKKNDYINKLGTSGFVMINDRFLTAKELTADPALDEFIEKDLIKIMDGIIRGPAGQAMDRAIYGKAFGIRGFGMEDIINMFDHTLSDKIRGKHYTKIDKVTGEGEMSSSTLNNHDVRLMKAQLSTMRMAIRYAKGTMTRAELDAQDTPFFAFLNDVMSAATTAMVAPRYILGTLVEELPQAALKGYGEALMGIRGAVNISLKDATKAQRREVLRGITTAVRDIQHDAAVDTRFRGADSQMFMDDEEMPVRMIENMNRRMQKFAGLGFRELTQSIKSADARASVSRLDNMIQPGKNGESLFDALTEISKHEVEKLKTVTDFNTVLRAAGVPESQFTGVREMLRMGVFDPDTNPIIKRLMINYVDQNTMSFSFEGAQAAIARMHSAADRELHMKALMRIREMIKIDSIRNAKEATFEMANLQGGNLQQIMTRLTSYAAMVSSSLRRAALGGGATYSTQMILYMISGYAYFKASQMARGKSFDKAVAEGWRENPEVELYDMLMSVPFLGYAQMPISFLMKQVGLGSIGGLDQFSVQGGKAYSLAGVSTLNRALALLGEAPKAIKGMFDESSRGQYGAADYMNAMPIAFNWAWGPILGAASDDMFKAETLSKSGFTAEEVKLNPGAYAAWAIKQMINPRGASLDLPTVNADGLVEVPSSGRAVETAQDLAAIESAKAAAAVEQAVPSAQMPTAAGPIEPTPEAPAAEPLVALPSFKPAPDTLK